MRPPPKKNSARGHKGRRSSPPPISRDPWSPPEKQKVPISSPPPHQQQGPLEHPKLLPLHPRAPQQQRTTPQAALLPQWDEFGGGGEGEGRGAAQHHFLPTPRNPTLPCGDSPTSATAWKPDKPGCVGMGGGGVKRGAQRPNLTLEKKYLQQQNTSMVKIGNRGK